MQAKKNGFYSMFCDICGTEIPEGKTATATVNGMIESGKFEMVEPAWTSVMCNICADQINEVSAELDRAMELLGRSG